MAFKLIVQAENVEALYAAVNDEDFAIAHCRPDATLDTRSMPTGPWSGP